mmetsp:Transcript_24013/g.80988  ORF Transcript_24013/g.80988 Transcript_24013/m.80988 type:complete len:219 (+) Transcript_24013:252-908(+)
MRPLDGPLGGHSAPRLWPVCDVPGGALGRSLGRVLHQTILASRARSGDPVNRRLWLLLCILDRKIEAGAPRESNLSPKGRTPPPTGFAAKPVQRRARPQHAAKPRFAGRRANPNPSLLPSPASQVEPFRRPLLSAAGDGAFGRPLEAAPRDGPFQLETAPEDGPSTRCLEMTPGDGVSKRRLEMAPREAWAVSRIVAWAVSWTVPLDNSFDGPSTGPL